MSDDPSLCGEVICETVAGRSALTRVWATDPLKLLTPKTSGPACHVVSSTYGGGLLGGDRVAVRVAVRPGAALAMTTQSAGKVYRTDGAPSVQTIDADVGDGATLAVLPDATCVFADGRFRQRQRFALAASANLVWLDWLTSGRHARGERWAMREIDSRTEIIVNGVCRLRETLSLDAGAISPMRVGRFDCYAVLAVVGPGLAAMMESGRSRVRGLSVDASSRLLAADSAFPGGAIFRILGPDVQTVRPLLTDLLRPLDAVLGHAPWGRKW